jgi:hypothetical protein
MIQEAWNAGYRCSAWALIKWWCTVQCVERKRCNCPIKTAIEDSGAYTYLPFERWYQRLWQKSKACLHHQRTTVSQERRSQEEKNFYDVYVVHTKTKEG